MREFQKIQPEQPVPEVPVKSNFQIGPFVVDEACSDDDDGNDEKVTTETENTDGR